MTASFIKFLTGAGLCLAAFFPFSAAAGVPIVSTIIPTDISACETATFEVTVTNVDVQQQASGTLQYCLPLGLQYAGSTGATPVDVSDPRCPVFALPDLASGASFSFQIQVRVGCLPYDLGDVRDTIRITAGGVPQPPALGSAYNLRTPVITLIQGQNWSYTGANGEVFTRTFTFRNEGFGSAFLVYIIDPFASAGLELVQTTGIFSGDTLKITGADLGPNGFLGHQDSVTITQRFRLKGCGSQTAIVEYGWACSDGIPCSPPRFDQYNMSGGSSPQPNVEISLVNPFPKPRPCEPEIIRVRLENKGTTPAYGIEGLFALTLSESELANGGMKSDCYRFENFRIGNTPLMDFTSGALHIYYQLSLTVVTADPDGPGGVSDLDGNGLFDDLAPGQSCFIEFDFSLNPDCKSCNELLDPLYFAALFYYDSDCSIDLTTLWTPNVPIGIRFDQNKLEAEHAFIFDAGTTYDFEYAFDATFSGLQMQCPDDSIIAEFILPATMTIPPGFQPEFNGAPIPWWTTTDTARVYLLLPNYLGDIHVPLLAVCPPDIDDSAICTPVYEPRTYQTAVNIRWICGNGCSESYELVCLGGEPFTIDCPRLDDSTQRHGASADVFTVRRISLGYVDNALSAQVDPATPGLDLAMGIPYDSVLMQAEARIEGMPGETFDSMLVQVYYWNGVQEYFQQLSAAVVVEDAETGQVLQCPGLILDYRYNTDGYHVWETNLDALAQPGGCLSGAGVQLTAGDRVYLEILARLTEALPYLEVEEIKDLRVRFPHVSGGDTILCETQNARFQAINPEYEYIPSLNFNNGVCDDLSVELTFIQGLSARILDDLFPNEIRPLFVYDTMTVELNPGYVYRPGSARWQYSAGDGALTPPTLMQIPLADPQITTLPDGSTSMLFVKPAGLPVTDFYQGRATATLSFRAQIQCPPDTTAFPLAIIGHKLLCILDSLNALTGGTIAAQEDLNELGFVTSYPLSGSRVPTWIVQFCNPSIPAPSIAIPEPLIFVENGMGLNIQTATDITDATSPQPLQIDHPDPQNAVVHSLPLAASGCRTIELKASLTDCNTLDTILIVPGFQCAEAASPCIIPNALELYFSPAAAQAQVGVISSPAAPVNLCDPIPYEIKLINVGEGQMYDINLLIKLPQAGQVLAPGTFSVEYGGQTAPLPDPVQTPDGLLINLDLASLPFSIESVPGLLFAPNNAVVFRFQLETNCEYLDGTRLLYAATWQDVCGDPRETADFVAPPLEIAGAPDMGNSYQINWEMPVPASFCAENSIHLSIVNPGDIGPTGSNEKVRVILPTGFEYVPGSFQPGHNGPTGAPVIQQFGDAMYLTFGLPAGVVAGDSMVFDFQIRNNTIESVCSASYTFGVQMLQTANVACAASSCAIDFVMQEEIFFGVFEKPVFTLSGLNGLALPLDAGLETWDLNFQVENLSSLPGGGSLDLEIRLDGNQNTKLDPTDALLRDTAVQVEGLPAASALGVSVNVPVASTQGCSGLWVVLVDTVCSCTRDSIFLPFVRLTNSGTDTTVCAGATATLGAPPLANATYSWLTASPYLSSTASPNPAYRYTGTFTNSFVFVENLVLQTTRPQGCTSLDTIRVETRKVEVTLVPTDALCWGEADGSIAATVQGAAVQVQYFWSTGPGPVDSLFNLPAGIYALTVVDALGCADTASVQVSQPDSLVVALATGDFNGFGISCAGANDGSISAAPTGGVGGYQYAWSPNGSGPNLTDLSPGTYSLTLTDANGCTTESSAVISVPPPLVISLAATDEICLGGANGTITVTTQGGVAPYSVNGASAGATYILQGLNVGTYDVLVTDANGCTTSADTSIGVLFSTVAISADSATCFGEADGRAEVTAIGHPPFSFFWSSGQTQSVITGPATAYSVTVFDALGCMYTLQTEIDEPPALIGIALADGADCFGDSTGQITLSAQGGTPPYSFTSGGLPVTSPATDLPAGVYTFLLTDGHGCTASLSAEVTQPDPIVLALVPTNALCFGSSTGSVSTAPAGGALPYSFQWSNGAATENLAAVPAGDYTLTFTDANGCSQTATTTVGEPQPYEPEFEVLRLPCTDRPNGSFSISGFPPGTLYGLSLPPLRDTTVFDKVGGGPLVLYVEDSLGCLFEFDFEMPALPEMIGELFSDTTLRLGDSVLLHVELSPDLPPDAAVQIQWLNPIATLSPCDTCPELWVRPFASAYYTVRFTTASGCTSESRVLIQVVRDSVYAPNALYSDAILDENRYFTLFARPESIREIRLLRIFDRWGEAVFERAGFAPNDYPSGWDGRYRGQPVLPGVYVWYAEVEYHDGFVLRMQGDVTVVR
ncbi:MAG: gliding motility-associated C-terminal domain-containing protein [Saprospiraceae bacterium]|jgi:hypothetical protein|nr:gliding motility-associated C-terminal domain-containing protein [Saprospiraceae bacterium]